jgi:proline dehydrogenase
MKLVRNLHGKRECPCREKGYPSPICASKEATDENYDAAVSFI